MTDDTRSREGDRGRAAGSESPEDDGTGAHLTAVAKLLAQSVVLTGERVQEAFEDAVRRGRMTRQDAQELAGTIVAAGRRQTEELRGEVEQLLGRGREKIAGSRPGLPIDGYDDLTAAQVVAALEGLPPAELRRVRDHEARAGNRKTVLRAIDRKLG